jgi:ribosomal-protein-alanine N-acetyltransferase
MLECRTERMLVRPLRSEDRAEFLRVHEVSRKHFADWIDDRTPEDRLRAAFRGMRSETDPGDRARLVGESPDGRIVGFFNLSEIVRGAFNSAYASWYVNVEFAGDGLGTEGVRALLDLAFSESGLALHRVQANIIPGNIPSIRLAERVGFRKEGLAKRYLRIAGRWQDHAMYAKTAEEHRFTYLPGRAPGAGAL